MKGKRDYPLFGTIGLYFIGVILVACCARNAGLSLLASILVGYFGVPLVLTLVLASWQLHRRIRPRWAAVAKALVAVTFFVPLLSSCSTTGGVTPVVSVTPAAVASLAYDAGYLAYGFGGPQVQAIVKGVCLIDTTQTPDQVAAAFQQILQQAWSGFDQLSSGQATAIMLLINNLVTQLGLQNSVTSLNVSPDIMSAIQGFCQGVEAFQAGTVHTALIKAAMSGALQESQIPEITIGAPPEMVAPAMPITQQASSAWETVVKGLEFWKW